MRNDNSRVTSNRKVQEVPKSQVTGKNYGFFFLGEFIYFIVAFSPQTKIPNIQNFITFSLQNPCC